MLDDASHMVMMEQPHQVNTILSAFMRDDVTTNSHDVIAQTDDVNSESADGVATHSEDISRRAGANKDVKQSVGRKEKHDTPSSDVESLER